MKDKNKIEFDMWERQVLAAATDHSDTAIRQAMLQSLKGQALMVTTTLPPNTHWKDLLQALRIKYQSKAPYDVLMSQFYSTKMDASEDCASFGIRLEQKLNQVTLQYPDKISTKIYWNHVRDRFFHGLSPIMKANLRTEFQSGSDYYKLLDIAREIEAERMSADSVNETSKSTHGKGKPKVGAITVDSTTAQQISQLQGAVKGLTNWMKGVQLNTNPLNLVKTQLQVLMNLLLTIQILHLHLEVKVAEVEVEVEEVSDLGQVKSCAIGVRILFLKRKLVTK